MDVDFTGICNTPSPDGTRLCVMDTGHKGPHGWESKLDFKALFASIDDFRDAKGQSWTEAAEEIGVESLTLLNLARQDGVEPELSAHELLRIYLWLGPVYTDLSNYVVE